MGGAEKRRDLGLQEFVLTGARGGRRGRRAARKWWSWAPLEAEVGWRGESDEEEGGGDEVSFGVGLGPSRASHRPQVGCNLFLDLRCKSHVNNSSPLLSQDSKHQIKPNVFIPYNALSSSFYVGCMDFTS